MTMIAGWSLKDRAKLTTWLVDQRRGGEVRPMIDSYVLERVRSQRHLNFSDKKRRLFLWISSRGFKPHHDISYGGQMGPITQETLDQLAAWMECEEDKEVGAIMKLMVDAGLFNERSLGRVRLATTGFEYLEEIETGGAPTDQAFVAMWFNPAVEAIYDEAIAPAIEDAGYRPFRVDRKETLNKIDDEIIAEIRRSRFLVADFTCHVFECGELTHSEPRGGVYYEAGFAAGLNTPVIWTVRDDCIDYLHFDTRQYPHIVWSDAAGLREKLTNRIRANLGQGPRPATA
jgi:hypothetical protein